MAWGDFHDGSLSSSLSSLPCSENSHHGLPWRGEGRFLQSINIGQRGQRLETLAMLVLLLSVEGTNDWEGMRPKALLAPGLAPYFDF